MNRSSFYFLFLVILIVSPCKGRKPFDSDSNYVHCVYCFNVCVLHPNATAGYVCAPEDDGAIKINKGTEVAPAQSTAPSLKFCLPNEFEIGNLKLACCVWSLATGCEVIEAPGKELYGARVELNCRNCQRYCPCINKAPKNNCKYIGIWTVLVFLHFQLRVK